MPNDLAVLRVIAEPTRRRRARWRAFDITVDLREGVEMIFAGTNDGDRT